MRLDKYLKVSRIIKRRTVANEACDSGRVIVNGKPARASYDVKIGDIIEVSFGERVLKVRVKEIKELGSHHMIIADVLSIDADKKYIDENGAFDISKCDLIAYSNGKYYSLGKKIGKFGWSVEKKKK